MKRNHESGRSTRTIYLTAAAASGSAALSLLLMTGCTPSYGDQPESPAEISSQDKAVQSALSAAASGDVQRGANEQAARDKVTARGYLNPGDTTGLSPWQTGGEWSVVAFAADAYGAGDFTLDSGFTTEAAAQACETVLAQRLSHGEHLSFSPTPGQCDKQ